MRGVRFEQRVEQRGGRLVPARSGFAMSACRATPRSPVSAAVDRQALVRLHLLDQAEHLRGERPLRQRLGA